MIIITIIIIINAIIIIIIIICISPVYGRSLADDLRGDFPAMSQEA